MSQSVFLFLVWTGVGIAVPGVALLAKARGKHPAWCFLALFPWLGLFLGLAVGMVRSRAAGASATLILFLLGMGMLIFIPGFMSYKAKARQGEAKAEIGRIYVAATNWRDAHHTYEVSEISQLKLATQGRLYSIWYAVNGVPTRVPLLSDSHYVSGPCDVMTPPTSVQVVASATGFTAAAKGNIDGDDTCDEWSINDSREREHTLDDLIQ
jgi:hypothetical protein